MLEMNNSLFKHGHDQKPQNLFNYLLVLVVVISMLISNNPTRCFEINNTTMRIDKSKLSQIRCNDIYFRIQLEISWLNQTSLFESPEKDENNESRAILAYKHKPCEMTPSNEEDEEAAVYMSLNCDQQSLYLSKLDTVTSLSKPQTLKIIYNSYFRYNFQVLLISRTSRSKTGQLTTTSTAIKYNNTNNSSISKNPSATTTNLNRTYMFLSLSSMFASDSKKKASESSFAYEVTDVCGALFNTPDLQDCHHYTLAIYGLNNCTLDIVKSHHANPAVKYFYAFILSVLLIVLLVNAFKWTFFKYDILR